MVSSMVLARYKLDSGKEHDRCRSYFHTRPIDDFRINWYTPHVDNYPIYRVGIGTMAMPNLFKGVKLDKEHDLEWEMVDGKFGSSFPINNAALESYCEVVDMNEQSQERFSVASSDAIRLMVNQETTPWHHSDRLINAR